MMRAPHTENSDQSLKGLRRLFKNRFGHFRAGWRILLFIALTIALFEISDVVENFYLSIRGENPSDFALLLNRFVNKFLKLLSVVIPSVVLLKWLDKRPVTLFGIGFYKGSFQELSKGMLMGFAMGTVSIFILWITRVSSFTFNGISMDMLLYVLFCLIILVISASFEETLFRGYIFQSLIEGSSLWIAVCAYALLFAISHFEHGVERVAFAAAAGIFLGVLYYKTRSLWPCIGVHFVWNWIMAPVFGMGVEGSKFLKRSIFTYHPSESGLLGGSEAMSTIIQSLFMLILSIFIWKSNWLKPADHNKKQWAQYPTGLGKEPENRN